jgi:hypothetical protein
MWILSSSHGIISVRDFKRESCEVEE